MKNYCVSVVIVNWNRVDYLRNCINSLLKSTHRNLEIIIVDNGSTDGSSQYVQQLMLKDNRFKLHQNKTNLGFALPSNQGAELATGDILFLLNNDTIVDSECIERVVACFKEHPQIGVIQPRLMQNEKLMDEQGNLIMKNGYLLHFGYGSEFSTIFLETYPVFSVKGAAFFVSRGVYSKIGLFRPDFFAFYEETDFCHRCWLAGYPVFYFGGAVVMHIGHVTANEFKKNRPVWIWHQCYHNRLVSLSTLLSRAKLLSTLFIHIALTLCSAPLFIITGKASLFLGIITAHGGLIKKIPSIIRQRKLLSKQLNGFSESDIFNRFGLMLPAPRGYLRALCTGRVGQYWEQADIIKWRDDCITNLRNRTEQILLEAKQKQLIK